MRRFLSASLLPVAAIVTLSCTARPARAQTTSCKIVKEHKPGDAESAFLHGDYDHSSSLYQEALKAKPNDPDLTAGLAEVWLRQQKFAEAASLAQNALAANPQSSVLETALAAAQYRAGTPWLAMKTVGEALQHDPCNAEARLLHARILRLNAYYGSAAKELKAAHALDPTNPRILRAWLDTLSTRERIADLEAYLASPNGEDEEDTKSLRFYLAHLKQLEIEPHKACRLVSNTESTEIPFAPLMRDATHIRAFGLDVKLNDHQSRLQIDTGASGLLVSHSVAEHAGLKEFSRGEVGGVGSEGKKGAYTAFAEDIKIGSLEFKDCSVNVMDKGNVADGDGLIGMDVLSHFLITLDYPMRKLLLAPLPPRPGQTAAPAPTLETNTKSNEDVSEEKTAPTPAAPAPVSHGPYDPYIAPEMKDWTHIYLVGRHILLPASLNEGPIKLFIIDTGAFTTTITPEAAREVTKVHGNDALTVRGVSGKVDKVYSADSILFRFANVGQKIDNVVAFSNANLSKNMNLEISGMIGITALGQMTMSIDYRDARMKFDYDPKRGYKYYQ